MNQKIIHQAVLCVILINLAQCQVNVSDYESAGRKSAQYLEKFASDNSIPGLVAGVSIRGTPVWTYALGRIDIENDVRTSVEAVWRVASISKSITSALVGRLIDEGRLALNQSIHSYLPLNVFPRKTWNGQTVDITLNHVLSHTAGLHITDGFNRYSEDMVITMKSNNYKMPLTNVTQTLAAFKDEPLRFKPGTQFEYSNFGFLVVGSIIESVLNQSYDTAINQMFRDLDLKSTLVDSKEKIIPHRAKYYFMDESTGQVVNDPIWDDLNTAVANWPAGCVATTIPDLLRFGDLMIKWSKGESLPNVKSHGWFVDTFSSPLPCSKCQQPITRLVWHDGGHIGANTLLVLEPANEIVITYFINRANDSIYKVMTDLMKFFMN